MNQPAKQSPGGKSKYVFGGAGALLVSAMLLNDFAITEKRVTHVYLDSAGIPTVCAGLIGPITERHPGVEWTVEECKAAEMAYIKPMVERMERCVPMSVRAQFNVDTMRWFAHFGYNTEAFCKSDSITQSLLQGNLHAACRAMGNYVFTGTPGNRPPRGAGHKNSRGQWKQDCRDPKNKCSGLPKRRQLEVDGCLQSL